ncbi:MAG: hypothetical protein ACLUVP_00745 [Acutalibacter sp.]
MRNKCLCLALAVLLCFSLAGCHGSQERAAFTVPDSLSQDNYEITFWAKNTPTAQTDIYRAIEEFKGCTPITVNLRLYTDYGDIYNDVITNTPPAPPPTCASPTRTTRHLPHRRQRGGAPGRLIHRPPLRPGGQRGAL